MKYKKITCLLVMVCLVATLNGFPVIAMENDTAIQGELTDTISYDGVNEKPEEASTDTEESSPKAGTQEIEEPADQEEILEETAGSQENLRENSWRYQNGELISNSVSAYSNERAAANAWTKVNGNFISSSGEIIPNAIAKGIDISYHNGTINWDKVKNSDVDFVIIRCGYGDNYTVRMIRSGWRMYRHVRAEAFRTVSIFIPMPRMLHRHKVRQTMYCV